MKTKQFPFSPHKDQTIEEKKEIKQAVHSDKHAAASSNKPVTLSDAYALVLARDNHRPQSSALVLTRRAVLEPQEARSRNVGVSRSKIAPEIPDLQLDLEINRLNGEAEKLGRRYIGGEDASLSEHARSLLSRATKLDLGTHDYSQVGWGDLNRRKEVLGLTPHLETLGLSQLFYTADEIRDFPWNALKNLKSLNLDNHNIEVPLDQCLPTALLKSLHTLSLYESIHGLAAVKGMPWHHLDGLQELNIGGNLAFNRVNDLGKNLSLLKNLKSLSLRSNLLHIKNTEKLLNSLNLPALTHLNLARNSIELEAGSYKFDPETSKEIVASRLPSLTSLDLSQNNISREEASAWQAILNISIQI